MIGYIYITTNLINGKRYVGKKTSKKFLGEKYLGSGRYLKNAVKKYGRENFIVEMLEEIEDISTIEEREQYYIKLYNAVESAEFYNMTLESSPGMYGKNFNFDTRKLQSYKAKERCKTEEGKQNLINAAKKACEVEGRNEKISQTLKDKYQSGERKSAWEGKTMSDEIRQKMSESRMGHSTSDETKAKIGQSKKGKIYVVKDGVKKLIDPNNTQEYLNDGWSLTKKRK